MQQAIGILGTGRMGVRLARMFAAAGRDVILGSRDAARAERIVRALNMANLRPGSYDAALAAPVVLPAIFIRDGLFEQLEMYRERLAGKLYIDITNPFNSDYTDFILPWSTSGAEEIAALLPRTRIVGAFKNVWWEVFDEPLFGGEPSDVYVVSDDPAARREFLCLAEGTPFRYIDAGPLKNARTVERMTLLSGELGQRCGFFPRMNWRLLGSLRRPGAKDALADLIAR
ncbi:MAG: dinucleotide-binding enzyme [Planctomycetota bacterium]|nr:MAG: dinucleotide-binding enzyme [Planctomycetota bacterium]